MDEYSLKLQKCNEYIDNLEEERRKIQVFQRELPLCLDLVTQAIERCRQELICPEETTTTSNDRPVFEEFMPMRRHSSNDSDNDNDEDEESDDPATNVDGSGNMKSDWLSSVQLWSNQTLTLDPSENEDTQQKEVVEDTKTKVVVSGTCKALDKDKKEKSPAKVETTVASSPARTESGESGKEDKVGGQSGRKKRRCWSPELHRRFLNALQQLGGLHVATPKQIREFMKVDGLTNDEVKSHLQKYRLHTRRPSSNNNNNNNNNNNQQQQQQTPQFVVVGGIWVHPPPTEYSQMNSPAAAKITSGNVYAPIALMPQAKYNCTSLNTSSTRTTTASPIF